MMPNQPGKWLTLLHGWAVKSIATLTIVYLNFAVKLVG